MPLSPLDVCHWLENTAMTASLRESQYMYPLVEGTHVLGLAFSVGTVMWCDLRLIGATMRHHSVSEVFTSVRPWMMGGFVAMFLTGALLFMSHAEQAYHSRYFQAKFLMLSLALINVVVFHSTVDRRRAEWDLADVPPLQARAAGVVSLVLWAGIITAGRLMAYHLSSR